MPRKSTALDRMTRKDHIGLMVLAGVETATGGLLSIETIQKNILQSDTALIERFPAYADYFASSTWIAGFAGVLFLIYPVAFTLWITRVMIGMSLVYLVVGSRGLFEISHVTFLFVYFLTVMIAAISQFGASSYYLKKTVWDFYIISSLALIFVAWACYEFAFMPDWGGKSG